MSSYKTSSLLIPGTKVSYSESASPVLSVDIKKVPDFGWVHDLLTEQNLFLLLRRPQVWREEYVCSEVEH